MLRIKRKWFLMYVKKTKRGGNLRLYRNREKKNLTKTLRVRYGPIIALLVPHSKNKLYLVQAQFHRQENHAKVPFNVSNLFSLHSAFDRGEHKT